MRLPASLVRSRGYLLSRCEVWELVRARTVFRTLMAGGVVPSGVDWASASAGADTCSMSLWQEGTAGQLRQLSRTVAPPPCICRS